MNINDSNYGHQEQANRAKKQQQDLKQQAPRARYKPVAKDINKLGDAIADATSQAWDWVSERPGRAWAWAGGPNYDAMNLLEERIQKHSVASEIDKNSIDKSLKELDKDFKEICDELLNFASEGSKLYKPYAAWGQYVDKINETKLKQDQLNDENLRHLNETIAWFYRTALEEIDALRIAGKDEFLEAHRLALHEGVSKRDEINDMYGDAKGFACLSYVEAASNRVEAAKDHAKDIKKVGPKAANNVSILGPLSLVSRLKDHRKKAEERATELNGLLEEEQERRKILRKQTFTADKRLKADEVRFNSVKSEYEAKKKYQESGYDARLKKLELDGKETEKVSIDQNKEKRAKEADKRAEEAKNRAAEADKRVEEARKKAEAAEELGLDATAYRKAETAAKESARATRAFEALERLVADFARNGDIAHEKNTLLSIKNPLDDQAKALESEKDVIKVQFVQTFKEKQALDSLLKHYQTLALELTKAKNLEEKSAKATQELADLVKKKEKEQIITAKKAETVIYADNTIIHENTVFDLFSSINNINGKASEAIMHNAMFVEVKQKDQDHFDQSTQVLHEMADSFTTDDIKDRDDGTQAYLIFDPEAGRVTINGIWLEIKKINKWIFSSPDRTEVEFRPDITEIKLSRETRDAGKVVLQNVYAKRLLEQGIENSEYSLKLEIAGDTFTEGNRRRIGKLTYTNKKTKETIVKEFDMERTKSIDLTVDLINEKNITPGLSYDYTTETMPDPFLEHSKVRKGEDAPGYSPEKVQRMWRIHLPTRTIILPNGKRIKMEEIDWTETKYRNRVLGLAIQEKGPTEGALKNLKMAGSNLTPKMNDEKKLQGIARAYRAKRVKVLQQAANTGDRTIIEETWSRVAKHDASIAYRIPVLKQPFNSPPRTKDEWEVVQQRKRQMEALLAELEKKLSRSAADMQSKRKGYDSKLQERLRALRSVNDKYLRNYYENPSKYAFEKHSSAQDRKKLQDEISVAWHLDETFQIEILEDPNLAATFITAIADNAGEAQKFIKEIDGKSTEEAIKAQIEVEKEIFNKVNQALTTYRTDKTTNGSDNDSAIDLSLDEDTALEAFHASIREVINHATELQAKAETAKAAKVLARKFSGPNAEQAAKDHFIEKSVLAPNKKAEESILKEIIGHTNKELLIKLKADKTYDEINAERATAQESIKVEVKNARDLAIDRPKLQQHTDVIDAVARRAFKIIRPVKLQTLKRSSQAAGF